MVTMTASDAMPTQALKPESRGRAPFVLSLASLLVLGLATSAAAGSLITGERIKDGSLLGRDLRNASIRGIDVRDGSLTRADIVVPEGIAGEQGDPGPTGPAGARGLEFNGVPLTVSGSDTVTANATCSQGKIAVSGGVYGNTPARLRGSMPVDDGARWQVTYTNVSQQQVEITVYAVCVTDPA